MKKYFTYFLLAIIVIALIALVSGCTKKGTVRDTDLHIVHQGKTYELKSVTPCDGCNSVYILFPLDSTAAQPLVTNYSTGKQNVTVIQIQ